MTEQAPTRAGWQEQLQAAFAAKQAEYAKPDTTPTATTAAESPPEAHDTQADPVETEREPEQIEPTQAAATPREEEFLPDEPTDTPDIATLKKNLRSGFLKKMAELDTLKKDLESKAGGGLDAQKKAQVLDALLASPDPAAAIESARKGLGIASEAEPTQQWFKPRQMKALLNERGKLGDGPDHLHEAVIDPIEDMIDAYMETKVLPGYLPVLAWVQQQVQKGAVSEWDGLAAKYGEASAPYQRQAYELAAQANIPLEKALRAVLPDDILQQKATAQKVAAVERKQSQSTVRTNGLPPSQKGNNTYEAKRAEFVKALLLGDKNSKHPRYPENRI